MSNYITFIQKTFITNVTLMWSILFMNYPHMSLQVIPDLKGFRTLVTLVNGIGIMNLFKVFFLALISNELHSTNVTLILLFTNVMSSQHVLFQLVLFTVLFSTNVTELSFDLLINCFLVLFNLT